MKKEMLINALLPEETRIAILENGVLEELYVERIANENIVGNIYKGRIVNIEPSIQAAFVDFGIGRNGFLHISDVDPTYWEDQGGLISQVKDLGASATRPAQKPPRGRSPRPERPPQPADEFGADGIDFEETEGADPFAPRDVAGAAGPAPRHDESRRRGRGRGRGRDDRSGREAAGGEQRRERPSGERSGGREPGQRAGSPREEGQRQPREGQRGRGGEPSRQQGRGSGRGRDRDRGRGRDGSRRPPERERQHPSTPPPRQSDLPDLEDFKIEEDDLLREEPVVERHEPAPPPPAKLGEPESPAVEEEEDTFGFGLINDDDSEEEPRVRDQDSFYRRTPPGDDDFGKGLFDEGFEDEESEVEESSSADLDIGQVADEEDLGVESELDESEEEPEEPAAPPMQRYDDEDAFAGFADAEIEEDECELSVPKTPAEAAPTQGAPESRPEREPRRRRRGRRGRRGEDREEEGPRQQGRAPGERPERGPRRQEPRPSTADPYEESFEDDFGFEEFDQEPAEIRESAPRGQEPSGRGRDRRSDQGRPAPGRRGPSQRWADPRRPKDRPPIQEVFRRGQEVVVQVIKEGIGNKGPTLSTYISIPGRCLVAMPGLSRVGVSRKIVDADQRRRLRDIVQQFDRPEGVGFIVRTAGMDRSEDELERDLAYLSRLWEVVLRRLRHQPGPAVVYQETDVIIRTIRDIFNEEIETIYIDERGAYERAREFMRMVMPDYVERIKLYDDPFPMFNKFHIEEEIIRIQQRTVPLERGGSIVIEQSEALVAIDVNSGSFRADDNAEETAYQMNIAAAKEIARQLRLRDLGGVIVNDFIDMREERHRRAVENCLRDAVRRDRARTKILRMSAFGLIEMTRQRIRPSLKRSFYQECHVCAGTGHIKTVESMSIDCMRLLIYLGQSGRCRGIHLTVDSAISDYLQNHKRKALAEIEDRWRVTLNITGRPMTSPEEIEVHCFDAHGQELDIDVTHLLTRR